MQVVKVIRSKNGMGNPYIRLGVPAAFGEGLKGVTHMVCEFDGECLLYRPAITEPRKES
jgi:hypothetical protein